MRALFVTSGGIWRPSVRARVHELLPSLNALGIETDVLDPAALEPRVLGRRLARLEVVRRARRADVVVLQKLLLDPATLHALRLVNRRIVYDFDDAIYLRGPSAGDTTDARAEGKLRAALRTAREVIAGSDELAVYARGHARRVTMIPTVVDVERYARAEAPSDDAVVRIGWIGTANNLGALELVRDAAKALQTAGPSVRLRVVSSEPPSWADVPVEFEAWTLPRAIAAIHDFDIGIAPLHDTRWNRGKCGFKAIEYMAASVPTVASPVGALREIIEPEVNGLFASTQDEWRGQLERLVRDPVLRKRLGEAGRRRVEDAYSTDVAAPRLAAVLERVAA